VRLEDSIEVDHDLAIARCHDFFDWLHGGHDISRLPKVKTYRELPRVESGTGSCRWDGQ